MLNPEELYATARESLRSVAELISRGDETAAASAPSTSTQNQTEIYSSILVLKNAHRLLCENLEAVRQETQGVKAALDATSLKLENLRYQERHYQREIQACRAFTEDMEGSLMGDGIELVSEEDYRAYIAEEVEKDRFLQAEEEREQERAAEEEEEEGQVEEEDEGEEQGVASEEKEDGEDTEMADVDVDMLTTRKPKSEFIAGARNSRTALDHAHMFKLGRLHYEVERRKLALEELAALKSERDAVAADVAKRHTISSDISSEVARLKELVEKRLATFEGGGSGVLNVNAPEFHLPE